MHFVADLYSRAFVCRSDLSCAVVDEGCYLE